MNIWAYPVGGSNYDTFWAVAITLSDVFKVLKITFYYQDDNNLKENISLRSDGIYIRVKWDDEIIPYFIR